MASGTARSGSPQPSRMSAILSYKFHLASDAERRLGFAEVHEQMLKEEFLREIPTLPEEGEGSNALCEAEGILRDTHTRYLLCAESVKIAETQSDNIDAATVDLAVRSETRANLVDQREKLAALKRERSAAEDTLRGVPGFASHPVPVVVMALEAERHSEMLRGELEELQAEHRLAVDTLNSHVEHTQLSLPRRVPMPRIPVVDDGRRCEMCNTGFPASEVEIAPCGHFYHIFCLAIRVAMYPECCHSGCRLPFPPCWLRNYGFPSVALSDSDTESVQLIESSESDRGTFHRFLA